MHSYIGPSIILADLKRLIFPTTQLHCLAPLGAPRPLSPTNPANFSAPNSLPLCAGILLSTQIGPNSQFRMLIAVRHSSTPPTLGHRSEHDARPRITPGRLIGAREKGVRLGVAR